jgi:hypothetical protein
MIASTVGFDGVLRFDTSKPDGTPQKLLDVSRLFALGWRPQIALREGLQQTYTWLSGTRGHIGLNDKTVCNACPNLLCLPVPSGLHKGSAQLLSAILSAMLE